MKSALQIRHLKTGISMASKSLTKSRLHTQTCIKLKGITFQVSLLVFAFCLGYSGSFLSVWFRTSNPSRKTIYSDFPTRDLELPSKIQEKVENDENFIASYCNKEFGYGRSPVQHISFKFLPLLTRSIQILDVGGHRGRTSFPPIVCFPVSHKVITVEPVRKNQAGLLLTSARLGIYDNSYNWELIRAALSNETRDSKIYVPGPYTDNAALHPAAASDILLARNLSELASAQPVRVLRGDDIFSTRQVRPDYIKIDAQGAEALILQGLNEVLRENRNMLLVVENSQLHKRKFNLGLADAFNFMTELGFRVYCNPKVTVKDGNLIVRNDSKQTTINDIVNKQIKCIDLVYWKTFQ